VQPFVSLFFMKERGEFRQVVFYKNYFQDFFVGQRLKVKDKII